jgi:hypothetical protein
MQPSSDTLKGVMVATVNHGFVLETEWYWRIFEAVPVFEANEAERIARDFLRPLAYLARDLIVIDDIVVAPDGDGLQFRIGDRSVAIHCAGMRVERFVSEINHGLADADLDVAFAIVESRRYELRGVLVPRVDAARRVFARGTLPPTNCKLV